LAVEDLGGRRRSQPELPQQEQPLQSQQLLALVVAEAVAAQIRRFQQPHPVVVAQDPGRHTRHPGYFTDRPRRIGLSGCPRRPVNYHRVIGRNDQVRTPGCEWDDEHVDGIVRRCGSDRVGQAPTL